MFSVSWKEKPAKLILWSPMVGSSQALLRILGPRKKKKFFFFFGKKRAKKLASTLRENFFLSQTFFQTLNILRPKIFFGYKIKILNISGEEIFQKFFFSTLRSFFSKGNFFYKNESLFTAVKDFFRIFFTMNLAVKIFSNFFFCKNFFFEK